MVSTPGNRESRGDGKRPSLAPPVRDHAVRELEQRILELRELHNEVAAIQVVIAQHLDEAAERLAQSQQETNG